MISKNHKVSKHKIFYIHCNLSTVHRHTTTKEYVKFISMFYFLCNRIQCFIKTLPYFPVCQHVLQVNGGPKGEMCENPLSLWSDLCGGRQSTIIGTEVSIFYFCFTTSSKIMCTSTHTHTNTLDDNNSYSVGPLFTPEITPCQSGFFFSYSSFDWQSTLWGCLKRRSSSVVCQTGDIKKERNCVREKKRLDAHIKWQKGSHLSSLGAHKDVNQFKCHIEHCSNNAFDRNTEYT